MAWWDLSRSRESATEYKKIRKNEGFLLYQNLQVYYLNALMIYHSTFDTVTVNVINDKYAKKYARLYPYSFPGAV